ncbi:unnamed protein product [Euphydryas editha]|uniref:Gag-like protein n=1 Tax=Euphydryas editha TaxID=104508 RepID=A0AAU9UD64_EUPED|nr:unnamed protein product [Euphydryas editha]
MMPAIRTPTKQQGVIDQPPSPSNQIKKQEVTDPPSTPPKQVKKTDATKFGEVGGNCHRLYVYKGKGEVLVISPGAITKKSRVREAAALATRAKTALGLSRNLKTEVKDTVLDLLDRLKKLVADSEADLQAERARKGNGGPVSDAPMNITTDATFTVPPDSGMSKKLEEHSRLLLENNERMKVLQEQLVKCSQAAEVQQRSYANVVASKPQQPASRPAALHSVVVTSENDEETADEVLGKVRQAIDAKEGWVKVDRVRKAKDRKVIMGFGTVEERKKAQDRLAKKGSGLVVEEVKNRDPLLVLRGVLAVNTDGDVIKALRNQNRDLFNNLGPGEDRLLVKYRRRTRNPHLVNVVLSTSPTLWARITGVGSVHVDLMRVRAEDQSPLVQCTRCLGYGHGRKYCKDPADLCSHCGGPHLKAKCTDWLAGSPPSCRNCRRAKFDNIEHNAFSDDCPVRRRWDDLARSTVAYC